MFPTVTALATFSLFEEKKEAEFATDLFVIPSKYKRSKIRFKKGKRGSFSLQVVNTVLYHLVSLLYIKARSNSRCWSYTLRDASFRVAKYTAERGIAINRRFSAH